MKRLFALVAILAVSISGSSLAQKKDDPPATGQGKIKSHKIEGQGGNKPASYRIVCTTGEFVAFPEDCKVYNYKNEEITIGRLCTYEAGVTEIKWSVKKDTNRALWVRFLTKTSADKDTEKDKEKKK